MSVDGGSDVMRQMAKPKQDERRTHEVIIHYKIQKLEINSAEDSLILFRAQLFPSQWNMLSMCSD